MVQRKDTCIEIVINDWAMADIIAKQNVESARPYLIPCLGILLNKRKKDPRFPYKKGDKSLYSQNNLNADFYREYLQSEFGIQRYEWESCGYEQEFPPGKKQSASSLLSDQYFPVLPTPRNLYNRKQRYAASGERMSILLQYLYSDISKTSEHDRTL